MKKFRKYLATGLLLMSGMLYFCICSLPDGMLHIYMLDVGQGDAFLIRTPAGGSVLVDGGPDDAVIQELAAVMPFYEHTIDTVILTHPHPDHVNGLVEVLRRYKVRQVIMTGISYDYPGYTAFLDELDRGRVQVIFADGRDYRTGKGNAASGASDSTAGTVLFDILFPFESLQGKSFVNANNSSIVFRLIYGNNVIYFSGDCELECETAILESGADVGADILKIGHHGSRTSSSLGLLDAVGAGSALIPVGADNSFKHPHGVTIKKLQERDVRIYRTDIDGRVEIESDGVEIRIGR